MSVLALVLGLGGVWLAGDGVWRSDGNGAGSAHLVGVRVEVGDVGSGKY